MVQWETFKFGKLPELMPMTDFGIWASYSLCSNGVVNDFLFKYFKENVNMIVL